MARQAKNGRVSIRSRRILAALGTAACLALSLSLPAQAGTRQPALLAQTAAAKAAHLTAAAKTRHLTINCGSRHPALPIECPDVNDSEAAFGHYVGHDEPGVWDY